MYSCYWLSGFNRLLIGKSDLKHSLEPWWNSCNSTSVKLSQQLYKLRSNAEVWRRIKKPSTDFRTCRFQLQCFTFPSVLIVVYHRSSCCLKTSLERSHRRREVAILALSSWFQISPFHLFWSFVNRHHFFSFQSHYTVWKRQMTLIGRHLGQVFCWGRTCRWIQIGWFGCHRKSSFLSCSVHCECQTLK